MSQSQRWLSRRSDGDDFVADPFTSLLDTFFPSGSSLVPKLSTLTGDIKIDFKETPEAFFVSADIPGVSKEDIKVSLNRDRMLSIQAERKEEHEAGDENSQMRYRERTFGQVHRSFKLPRTANPSDCSCKYENGVLRMRIGKTQPSDETNYLTVE